MAQSYTDVRQIYLLIGAPSFGDFNLYGQLSEVVSGGGGQGEKPDIRQTCI